MAEAGDVGDDAEVVGGERGVTELLEVGGPADEHVVEPRGEGDWNVTAHRGGVNGLAIGTFPWLLVARETMNAGGVAGMEVDEVGADQVAVLPDVEAWNKIVVADVALGR